MASVLLTAQIAQAHPILDVVVDDEVQFLVREAVVLGEHAVDFVNDGFRHFHVELIVFDSACRSVVIHSPLGVSLHIAFQLFGKQN